MDKSYKTSSKVEVAVVAAKPLKKGKRKAEEAAEQVPAKKQKKNEAALKQAIDKKQAAKTTKKSKKVESRSEDDFSSESEEEVKVKPAAKQPVKKPIDSSSEEDNSSEEGGDLEMVDVVSAKSNIKNAPKTPSTPQVEAIESRSLFMGNLSFSIEQSDVLNFFKNAGEVVDIFFKEDRETGAFEGCGRVEFATVEEAQNALKLAGQDLVGRPIRLDLARKRVAFTPGSGYYKKGGRALASTIFVRSFDTTGGEDMEPKSEVTVKKVPAPNVAKNGSFAAKKKDESSDEKDGGDLEMVDVVSAKSNIKNAPKTPSTPQVAAMESRSLFMGNLSFSIEQSDVLNFFKNAGEVVDIFFKEDRETGAFEGCGRVEFATVEEAQNALKLAGQDLVGRPIRLDLARKRVAFTPGSGYFKKGGRALASTIFVRSFDTTGGEDMEPKSEVTVKKVPAPNVAKNGSFAAKKKEESSDEKDGGDLEMVDVVSAKSNIKNAPKTPSTPQVAAMESRSLFMGNLSFSIEQSDVLNFFKNAGEVVDIFFKEDGETGAFEGCGRVEFATVEEAQNALKLAGQDLVGRPIRLDLARKRVAFTPGSGKL